MYAFLYVMMIMMILFYLNTNYNLNSYSVTIIHKNNK